MNFKCVYLITSEQIRRPNVYFTSLCTTCTLLETNVKSRMASGQVNKEHKYIKHLNWLLL
jgi:hypothetical protein